MEPGEVRLYTDEDVHVELARALREQGYDAVNARDQQMLGASDEEVWDYVVAQDRILFSYNAVDFAPKHAQWIESGKQHAGLILSRHYEDRVGALIRAMNTLLSRITADQIRSNLFWL